jgi:TonB-dependent SusC/RagA subfamily outer membrane receptor
MLIILLLLAGFTDDDVRQRRIREALDKFSIVYPQQKAYLHTDKNSYKGGDDLWIKAYLLNGINHRPDTLSTNLYVELISPAKQRVDIKRLKITNGFGVGDFHLSDTLSEGLYQIRAFTNWMQNFAPEFFFEKNFRIVNPSYTKIISPHEARLNQKKIDKRGKLEADFDMQFLPEGGNLVNGLESIVAFKAINKLGKGIQVDGEVYDDKGNSVTSFASLYKGMGIFSLIPEKGRNYTARVRYQKEELKIKLPEALETGLVMHAKNQKNDITVTLQSNRPSTADRSANEVILAGQCRGRIYFIQVLSLKDGMAAVDINKSLFPSGIVQLTAFSGRNEPLAERLVFVNHLDALKISLNATDSVTDNGTKVKLAVAVSDLKNNPVVANLSMSVVREKQTPAATNYNNMVSNMLLTSDLKGYVEEPASYLRNQAPETLKALDLLMLTNGWRRFSWDKILAGEYPKIKFHEEKGISLYGQITHDFFSIPLKNCKVQLSILDRFNDVYTTYTDEKGYFLFENMVYYDTISAKIESWRRSGRRNLVIVLPENEKIDVVEHLGDYSLITQSERDNKAYRREMYEEGRIALKKAEEKRKEEENNQLTSIYSDPDFVLRSESFPKGNLNVLEVMKGRIPGVNVVGDRVIIRGPSSLYGNTQPLFLIDGVPTHDVEAVKSIPIEEVDRIEVLKGPSAAIFGIRGANGVIAIYTKRGQFMKRGVIEFDMLGYSTPRDFYVPKYMPENEPGDNYTLLWQPVIITGPSGKAFLLIDKPLVKGDYRFTIEGASYKGQVGTTEMVINNE